MNKAVRLTVKGRVQGVGFRWFVYQEARKLDVKGVVRNLYNGDVEIEAEGESAAIERLISAVRKGPIFARVAEVVVEPMHYTGRFDSFEITH
ncbi:MAG: acylphosphatase [Calditrichaeota bacterium]|nr:MAG: acylphosphatase [Calditrichota bacterium]